MPPGLMAEQRQMITPGLAGSHRWSIEITGRSQCRPGTLTLRSRSKRRRRCSHRSAASAPQGCSCCKLPARLAATFILYEEGITHRAWGRLRVSPHIKS